MVNNSVEVNENIARALKTGMGIEFFTFYAAVESADIMEKNISQRQGTGKGYKRNGRVHVASAPGQSPTVDTGSLKNAIHVSLTGTGQPESDLTIESEYALDLEFGTSRMSSRPFIIKSVDEALNTRFPKIMQRFVDFIENGRLTKLIVLGEYERRFLKNATPKAKENWRRRRGS